MNPRSLWAALALVLPLVGGTRADPPQTPPAQQQIAPAPQKSGAPDLSRFSVPKPIVTMRAAREAGLRPIPFGDAEPDNAYLWWGLGLTSALLAASAGALYLRRKSVAMPPPEAPGGAEPEPAPADTASA